MKNILKGAGAAALGLLIALGPQFLFKACSLDCGCCGEWPICYWSTQAVLGIGFYIAALGLCLIIFEDSKIQLGILAAIFAGAVVAILIPYALIGGCPGRTMADYRRAFPGIAIVASVTMVYACLLAFLCVRKKK